MANVTVLIAQAQLANRVTVRTSGNRVYTLVSVSTSVVMRKGNQDGIPTSFTTPDSLTGITGLIPGSTAAAIDSNDIIHCTFTVRDSSHGGTVEQQYVQFDTGADTFGTVENVATLDGDGPPGIKTGICVDANDDPHVMWRDAFTDMGSTTFTNYYSNRISGVTSGVWNKTRVDVQNATSDVNNKLTDIMIADPASSENTDLPIIIGSSSSPSLNAYFGNVLDATSFTVKLDITGVIVPAVGSEPISIAIDSNEKITVTFIEVTTFDLMIVEHLNSNAWGTWETPLDVNTSADYQRPSIAIDDNDFRFIYAEQTTASSIVLFKNKSGTTWVEQDDTCNPDLPNDAFTSREVVAKWASKNNNTPRALDYIFHTGTSVIYNSFKSTAECITHSTDSKLIQKSQSRTHTTSTLLGGPNLLHGKSAISLNASNNIIKTDGGTLYAITSRDEDGPQANAETFVNLQIEMRKSTDGGISWSNPLDKSNQPGGEDFVHPSMAMDSTGLFHIIFKIEQNASPSGGHYTTFNPSTDTWDATVTELFNETINLNNSTTATSIAVDLNDDVHVYWADHNGSANRAVYTNNIAGGGHTFKTFVAVNTNISARRGKIIFDEDGFPFIITFDSSADDIKVHGGNAVDATTFETFTLNTDGLSLDNDVSLAKRANGDMLAVYKITNGDVICNRHASGDNPSTWGSNTTVISGTTFALDVFAIGASWFIIAREQDATPDEIVMFRVTGTTTLTATEVANDLFPPVDPAKISGFAGQNIKTHWNAEHQTNFGFPPKIDCLFRSDVTGSFPQEIVYHIDSLDIPLKAHTTDSFLIATQEQHTTDSFLAVAASAAVTEDHTTDSFLRRALAHSTDSFLKRAIAHSTDSFLRRALAHSTDSFLRRALAHSTDSFLKRAIAHSTDSLLLAHQEITHTTDSFLRRAIAHSTDSFLRRALAHSTDSFLSRVLAHSTDSFLKRAIAHSTDSFLVKVLVHSTDSLLLAHQELTHSTDSFLRRAIAHTTDSFLKRAISHSTDSFLKRAIAHSTDSFLLAHQELTHTTDSLLLAHQILTHTTDSFLRRAIAHTTDSFLRRAIAHSTDSFLRRALAHSTDSLLQAHFELTHTTDSFLRRAIAHTTDSFLKRAIAHSTDSFLISVGGLTHTTDSLLLAHQEITHTTDSFLRRAIAHSTDSFLRKAIAHTTDSFLLAHQTLTHTTDSLLLSHEIRIHTTDSFLRRAIAHSTDSFLRRAIAHSTDSFLLAHQELTHTTDSLLLAHQTLTHTTDSLLLAHQTRVHTTDSFLTRALAHSTDSFLRRAVAHTTDSYLAFAISLTHTTDSLLQAQQTVIHTTDSFLRRAIAHSTDSFLRRALAHSTDSFLLGQATLLTHTTNSILKKFDIVLTHSTDSILQPLIFHTTDSYLAFVRLLTHTTDSLLEAHQTLTHSTDSLLADLEVVLTHSTDSILGDMFSVTHTTDSTLKKIDTLVTHTTDSYLVFIRVPTHTTDSRLRLFQTTLTHTTDSFLRSISQTRTHTTDSFLRSISQTITHATDSLLADPGQVFLSHETNSFLIIALNNRSFTTDSLLTLVDRPSPTHTTDSILRSVEFLHHNFSSVLFKFGVVLTHSTDSVLVAVVELTHTTDSVINPTPLTHTTDSFLLGPRTLTHTTDSILGQFEGTRTHITDSLLADRGLTLTHSTDSFLLELNVLTHTTDSFLLQIGSLTHNTDGFLQLVVEPFHTTDSALQKFDLEITHSTDSYLGVVRIITHSTDSLLQETVNIVSHSTDSILTGAFIGAISKVILKREDRKTVIFTRIKSNSAIFAREKRNTGVIQ